MNIIVLQTECGLYYFLYLIIPVWVQNQKIITKKSRSGIKESHF